MSVWFLLAASCLLAWIYLLALHGRFWRADQRLPTHPPRLETWPEVAVVIPARDEADVIAETLASHMASEYRGGVSVILVDDHSTDGTGGLARAAGEASGRPLHVTVPPPLEPGWTGKLWALRHGLDVADAVAPGARYVLFTDADIVHQPDTLARLVAQAETDGLALVSLMARLDARGPWAGLLIPAFVFFFQKLYPFPRSNDRRARLAAAAGGSVLVRREALRAAGDLAPIRGALIDDCALARLIKGRPPVRPIWLGLADREVVSRRDNRRLASIWSMVTRTAFTQLDHSPARLLGAVAGMALVYLAGPAAALSWPLHGEAGAAAAGAGAWAAMTLAYAPTARLYGQPAWAGARLPASATLYAAMTVDSALRHWRGAGGRWKGRTYPAPPRSGAG